MPSAMLVTLYVLSFLLPTVGFVRLLWRARWELLAVRAKVEERGSVLMTFDDLDETFVDITREPKRLMADLWWDTALVGVGMLSGAVAGIWSLTI